MRVSGLISTILLLVFPAFVSGYNLVDTVIGNDFYNFFDWQAIKDPTRGRVQYVDESTSQNLNLTFASGDTFILRADHKETLEASGPGRKSVRIMSKKTYTQHVVVFDVRHMPRGCGTWPSIWEVKSSGSWPSGGEVDILEGTNDISPNVATLHTSTGCTMPSSREQKGTSTSLNCYSTSKHNQGCSVRFPSQNSYGPLFNSEGGGWYALERTTGHIKIWFWSRSDPNTPYDVKTGASSTDPSSWGEASAYFPSTSCDFASHFKDHNIIINLDFCGALAGSRYSRSGCPSTCVDYVNNNPQAFKNAYFNFASIRIYQ